MHGGHAPCHQARTIGHADRTCDIEPVESRAARCNSIDIRRAQHRMTVAAEKISTVLIGDEKNEIGAFSHDLPLACLRPAVNRTSRTKAAKLRAHEQPRPRPYFSAGQGTRGNRACLRRRWARSRLSEAGRDLQDLWRRAIEPVIAAGHRVFGENRVQEAKTKWPSCSNDTPASSSISSVRCNRTKRRRRSHYSMPSIRSTGRALPQRSRRKSRSRGENRPLRRDQHRRRAAEIRRAARGNRRFHCECHSRHGLEIARLMCIPPADEPPAPHFALTAKIARRNSLSLLSMGMSAGFPIAIEFGATHVRVGTAIFGARG